MSIISIPSCRAIHVLGPDSEVELSHGTLNLTEDLVLTVGSQATFQLPKPATAGAEAETSKPSFGTIDGRPFTYVFQPAQLADAGAGHVRLELPSDQVARDAFEQILVKHGLLLTGVRAAGDELMRSTLESARRGADTVQQRGADHISTTQPGEAVEFQPETHQAARDASDMTKTAADKTTSAVGTVLSYAMQGGQQISKAVGETYNAAVGTSSDKQQQSVSLGGDESSISGGGGNDGKPFMADTRQAAYEAGSGVAQAVSQVASSTKNTTSDVLSHNYGEQASQLASTTGESVANVGKTAAAAVHGFSLTGVGAGVAAGAAQGPSDTNESIKSETQ